MTPNDKTRLWFGLMIGVSITWVATLLDNAINGDIPSQIFMGFQISAALVLTVFFAKHEISTLFEDEEQ